MEKGIRVIAEGRYIKGLGYRLGWVLFFSNLIAMIFISECQLLLKINMLLIIAGLFILRIRPLWQ